MSDGEDMHWLNAILWIVIGGLASALVVVLGLILGGALLIAGIVH